LSSKGLFSVTWGLDPPALGSGEAPVNYVEGSRWVGAGSPRETLLMAE